MERAEAISRLTKLIGCDLRAKAEELGVTVFRGGKLNKGWPGHVIERVLGLPLNSAQSPNFGSWELKVISLRDRRGVLYVKETMAITMLDPYEVAKKEFRDSHLFSKLCKIVICARIFESTAEEHSVLYSVNEFDLDDEFVYRQVESDYDLIRETILTRGFGALSGRMGVLVQPRTKGPGHGSTSRAFYARTSFVRDIVTLGQPSDEWVRDENGMWSFLRYDGGATPDEASD